MTSQFLDIRLADLVKMLGDDQRQELSAMLGKLMAKPSDLTIYVAYWRDENDCVVSASYTSDEIERHHRGLDGRALLEGWYGHRPGFSSVEIHRAL